MSEINELMVFLCLILVKLWSMAFSFIDILHCLKGLFTPFLDESHSDTRLEFSSEDYPVSRNFSAHEIRARIAVFRSILM